MSRVEPVVIVMPDPGDVRFDDKGTPFITFECYPDYGDGWVLYYLDDPDSPTAGVESYYIGGELGEIDWALTNAREWLWMHESGRRTRNPDD